MLRLKKKEFQGYVLIVGPLGVLGDACVLQYKLNNWWVGCVELLKSSSNDFDCTRKRSTISITDPNDTRYASQKLNKDANVNILIDPAKDLNQQEEEVKNEVDKFLKGGKLDAVICTAAEYSNGNLKEQLSLKVEVMWRQNVWPSILAATIAGKYLKSGGMLCLSGADVALNGTPNMIAYGIAKAGIHQLTKSLASNGSALPKESLCIALLNVTADTVTKREKPQTDLASTIAAKSATDLIFKWSTGENRPANGSLIQFTAKKFQK